MSCLRCSLAGYIYIHIAVVEHVGMSSGHISVDDFRRWMPIVVRAPLAGRITHSHRYVRYHSPLRCVYVISVPLLPSVATLKEPRSGWLWLRFLIVYIHFISFRSCARFFDFSLVHITDNVTGWAYYAAIRSPYPSVVSSVTGIARGTRAWWGESACQLVFIIRATFGLWSEY